MRSAIFLALWFCLCGREERHVSVTVSGPQSPRRETVDLDRRRSAVTKMSCESRRITTNCEQKVERERLAPFHHNLLISFDQRQLRQDLTKLVTRLLALKQSLDSTPVVRQDSGRRHGLAAVRLSQRRFWRGTGWSSGEAPEYAETNPSQRQSGMVFIQ